MCLRALNTNSSCARNVRRNGESMLYLVTGGSGSGKSEYGENLAAGLAGKKSLVYVATMFPYDEESYARIARHREQRAGKGFFTVECFTGAGKLSGQPGEVFLLDCMSNLLANEMYLEGGSIRRRDGEAVRECRQAIIEPLLELGRKKELVIVSNEVFSDGVSYGEETACYLALLGEIHRQLAGEAAEVTEVVCGIPVPVKPVPNRI